MPELTNRQGYNKAVEMLKQFEDKTVESITVHQHPDTLHFRFTDDTDLYVESVAYLGNEAGIAVHDTEKGWQGVA